MIYVYDINVADQFDIYGVREDGEYDPKIAEVYTEEDAKLIVEALNDGEKRGK